MRYRFGCELAYEVGSPTLFVLNVEAARIASHHDLEDALSLSAEAPRRAYVFPETESRQVSFVAPVGNLLIRYEGAVDLVVAPTEPGTVPETPLNELPLDVMPYLLPSRFAPSDLLGDYAHREFAGLVPGFSRVTAICNWIYDNLRYQRGSSDPRTTATETLIARAGVCRDFAHLAIAFCRAMHIPARFVSAYAYGLQPCDFHAVFEAYLGGRWWLFDPTRQAALDGIVRIGVGRDAADVAFASFFGPVKPGRMQVWIEPEAEAEPSPRTVAAVSTA